jgi:haloalkane dehalogenase
MDEERFRARQTIVELDGLSYRPLVVAYTDVGTGSPLLLLHGIPTWSYLYAHVIERLAASHRVIAPDLLGHGYSDHSDRFDRSLVAQQAMVRRLLRHLGLNRVTVVGHDTGGGTALRLAVEDPELLDRLVLSNAVAYDSWPIADMLELADPAVAHRRPEEVAALLVQGLREGLSRPERLTAEFTHGIVAPYRSRSGLVSLVRNASALNTSHTTELTERLGEISAPTLLLWGVDDPWQRLRDAERLEQDIPGAELVRIERASHWVPQDAPEEWTAAVLAFTP